jgi:hypothetical protein
MVVRVPLSEGEDHLGSSATLKPWHALLWLAVIFGSGSGLLGFVIVIALLTPEGAGMSLYDRVVRLVLEINGAIFGTHAVHLTNRRLIVDFAGETSRSIPLERITATQTSLWGWRGNLVVHSNQPGSARINLWVVQRDALALSIQEVCRRVRLKGRR